MAFARSRTCCLRRVADRVARTFSSLLSSSLDIWSLLPPSCRPRRLGPRPFLSLHNALPRVGLLLAWPVVHLLSAKHLFWLEADAGAGLRAVVHASLLLDFQYSEELRFPLHRGVLPRHSQHCGDLTPGRDLRCPRACLQAVRSRSAPARRLVTTVQPSHFTLASYGQLLHTARNSCGQSDWSWARVLGWSGARARASREQLHCALCGSGTPLLNPLPGIPQRG